MAQSHASGIGRGGATRQWTQAQRAAIDHDGGDLLVSAAAGSGKTAVLAERCARLVCEGVATADGSRERCDVENLLVLTFTEAAANEMRGRIADAIRVKARQIGLGGGGGSDQAPWLRRQAAMVDRASVSTLHGFCSRVLRHHFHEAQIDPNFEVIDQEEAALLRDEVLDDLLAKYHKLPGLEGEAFTRFFEAYAQGRESACRGAILTLHDMLASTADRAAYLATARRVYSPEGCAETFKSYLDRGVCTQLRLLATTAARVCDMVRRVVGPGPMLTRLAAAQAMIEQAHLDMLERGADAWSDVRDRLDFDWGRLTAVKSVADFEGLKKQTWEAVKNRLKKIREETMAPDPAVMLKELAALAAPLETLISLAEAFDAAFMAGKRSQNRVDFNDLERLTLTLLTRPESQAAAELRKRYHFLLVDEVQDINPLQWTLLEAVRSPLRFGGNGNLFMVGDVKQSIYGFRLAEPGLFLKREREWRVAEALPKKYVSLPHNFRSQAKLLAAMNGVFERMLTEEVAGVNYAQGHALVAGSAPVEAKSKAQPAPFDGSPVEMHLVVMDRENQEAEEEHAGSEAHSEESDGENLSAVEFEARMVAQRIAAMLAEKRPISQKDGTPKPLAKKDIAILLRGMKNKAMLFARALAHKGIEAHADLSSGFFDTPEVRDTLALLQVLDNPRQDIPLATVMLGPFGGFSHDDLGIIRLTYDQKEVPFAEAVARYPQDGALAADITARGKHGGEEHGMQDYAPDAPPFSEDLASRLRIFFARLQDWRELLHARPLHEGLADIFSESKILVYVAGMEAGTQRVANLQMLHQRALKFAGFRKQGLHWFLRFIDKLREGETGDIGEAPVLSEASDVVRIMSVHKSKGLEFPVVFVSGLGSKLNLREGGPVYIHRDLGVGLEVADLDRNVSYPSAASARIVQAEARTKRAEELRLLYVAMTRARDHLVLTGHVMKQQSLERVRRQWAEHEGPLPEDLLLKAGTALDWVLSAVTCGGRCGDSEPLHVQWGTAGGAEVPQLQIVLHAPGSAAAQEQDKWPEADAAARQERITRILAGQSLVPSEAARDVSGDAEVARVLDRVMGTYTHAAAAAEPAVRTVTFLKTISETAPATPDQSISPESDELAAVQMPDEADLAFEDPGDVSKAQSLPSDPAAGERARQRGIATHRLLELLDLSKCDSAAGLQSEIQRLQQAGILAAEECERADMPGIEWALLESNAGRRLVSVARAGRSAGQIRRELPFTWTAPLVPGEAADPADWPTIRGVIDALIIDPATRTAELLDYKTDAAFLYESRLEDYTRQMRYYLRAASEILGFPVEKATLLFLAARQEHEVTLPGEVPAR